MTTDGGLDVIGDVHGEHGALVRLLTKMGYGRRDGAWRHPERQAVFVGDLIDRGNEQVNVVTLVREMHDAGTAQVVMGNHEWNALAWVTERPGRPGRFLRDHNDPNKRSQHGAFLAQVGEGSPRHHEYLRWFATLPLWLDLPGLRVVHACWQKTQIDHLTDRTNGTGRVTYDLLLSAHTKGSSDHRAVETSLCGVEVTLPDGRTFNDRGGKVRHEARIAWWDEEPRNLRRSALVDDEDLRVQLPDVPLPALEVDTDPRPIIFGHYWARGTPTVKSNRAVCVDYSVGSPDGSLVAYRWRGERDLQQKNLVVVPRVSNN